jgi:hypothetical protein
MDLLHYHPPFENLLEIDVSKLNSVPYSHKSQGVVDIPINTIFVVIDTYFLKERLSYPVFINYQPSPNQ